MENWELRYPEDEPDAFAGMWGFLSDGERDELQRLGLRLCECADDLFAASDDVRQGPVKLRAVVRFLISHGVGA